MNDTPLKNDTVLLMLRDLIHERTGIYYENGKGYLLVDKLEPLIDERGMDSYLDYYYLLKHGQDELEWRRVESALSVNETYFWREYDQIEAAANTLIPVLWRDRPGRPVRVWHAGSATGEEPYTLVMTLIENGLMNTGRLEIVASDLNYKAIEQAKQGIYRSRSFRTIPPEMKDKYFTPVGGSEYQIAREVIQHVQFTRLNLADPYTYTLMRNFDIIFCRNVFIYFSKEAIRQTAERFYESLNTPGHLFLAAAESLLRLTTLFDLVEVDGAFAYRKG